MLVRDAMTVLEELRDTKLWTLENGDSIMHTADYARFDQFIRHGEENGILSSEQISIAMIRKALEDPLAESVAFNVEAYIGRPIEIACYWLKTKGRHMFEQDQRTKTSLTGDSEGLGFKDWRAWYQRIRGIDLLQVRYAPGARKELEFIGQRYAWNYE